MEIFLVLFALFLSFLSSGFEVAYFRSQKDTSPSFIFAILLFNNFSNTLGASFFSLWLAHVVENDQLRQALEVVGFTAILIIFAEIIPKSIAYSRYYLFYNRLTTPIFVAFEKAVYWLYAIVKLFLPTLNGRDRERVSAGELLLPLNIISHKDIRNTQEFLLLEETLSLIQSTVRKFMTPITQVEMVPHTYTVEEMVDRFRATGYRFYPVYRSSMDDVVGVVDVSKLLFVPEEDPITKYMDKPQVVPDSMDALDFIEKGIKFAIVYDEFGNVSGIITRKAILKHLFNIFESNVKKVGEGVYILEEPVDLGLIEEITGIHLGEPNRDLNDFLLEKFDDIPSEGEEIEVDGIRFTVLVMDENRIEKVKMEVVKDAR